MYHLYKAKPKALLKDPGTEDSNKSKTHYVLGLEDSAP